MKLTFTERQTAQVVTDMYTLTVAADRPFVYLKDAKDDIQAALFALPSVHTWSSADDTVKLGNWSARKFADRVVLELPMESSVWDRKLVRFRCYEERIVFDVEVTGDYDVAEITYFGGYYSGQPRWGSGFFWSGQDFEQGFSPEPNTSEVYYFPANSSAKVDITGVPLPGRGDWFFTPPPYCFSMQTEKGNWIGFGVEAKPGANQYEQFRYRGQEGSFYLTLDYRGSSATLPSIGMEFGLDEYEVLERHVESLRTAGFVPSRPSTLRAAWWHEPIFCGWGAQCYEASLTLTRAADMARQENYEKFLHTLDSNNVAPGVVVLDDKWQAAYGTNEVDTQKWPDLRGFVEAQHAIGRKVVLWIKAWDCEGLPAELCVTNRAGVQIAFDMTNPQFEQYLRESIRRMLSDEPDCYNADGFKIDFTARLPASPGLRMHGKARGLELMRLYLATLHDATKKVKPDALVMTHTPHPYLSDVVDMIRLNDINVNKDVIRAMLHRARVARIACPEAIIDTDNWPVTNRAAWRHYKRFQSQLGTPSLYYSSHIDSTGEPLEPQDYRMIREVWASYRGRVQPQIDAINAGRDGATQQPKAQIVGVKDGSSNGQATQSTPTGQPQNQTQNPG